MSQYITYCRKSSDSEERQVLSIESQIKELKELTRRLDLPASEVLSESQSAKYPGRPVFNEIIRRIQKGQVRGIICWKLDRLARNPVDGSALIWALDQNMIHEIVTPHGTFKNNSNDKFLMQLEFGMAKKYVDDLSDNVKRGNRAKLERGWLPGRAPIGYLNEPKDRTIVKDPERFSLVRKMWDLLLQGVRPSIILNIATDECGLRTRIARKTGGSPLTKSRLYEIFGNPFYYGLIKRREGVFQGRHEPMISEEEYWRAQQILGRVGRPRPKRYEFAFTGLIRCGECSGMITAEEKYNRYGYHYVYYHCTKKKRDRACHQKCINLKELEPQILRYLENIHVPDNLLKIAIEYLESEAKEEGEKYLDIHKSLEKALTDCKKKLDNLNQMRIKDLITDEEYLREKRSLLEDKVRLERNIEDKDKMGAGALELTRKTFIFANQARDRFQSGSLDDQRTILQALGSNLSLRDKKIIIHAEKPFVILEKGLNGINDENYSLEPQESGIIKRKTAALTSVSPLVCAGEDSNLHALRHMHLKHAWLPVTAPARFSQFY